MFEEIIDNIVASNLAVEYINPCEFLFINDVSCKRKVPINDLLEFYEIIQSFTPYARQYFNSLDKSVVDRINEHCYTPTSAFSDVLDILPDDLPF